MEKMSLLEAGLDGADRDQFTGRSDVLTTAEAPLFR
jgi:hypothetical protein